MIEDGMMKAVPAGGNHETPGGIEETKVREPDYKKEWH